MAKSSKVEDYWRQHNIENLFKELTQILVRRMPSDPVLAIVEHLQKKFPKSFRTSKNTAQLHSDTQNESINDIENENRRSFNQSQMSGIVTIPTVGSAFTDLLKKDTNNLNQAPEFNLKNLVFANRLTQQVVRMGKDIRSDRDILEEEVIKPIKTKSTTLSTVDLLINSNTEDLQNIPTHEEPSVPQLIKYKQQIHNESDRRLHREKLAELAKHQREKEQFYQSDLSIKYEPIQQQNLNNDEILSDIIPKERNTINLSHKPIVKSQEEEEILNDENIFQSRKQRYRGKQRNNMPISRSNTPYIHRRHVTDFRSSMKKDNANFICKICRNRISKEENQSIIDSQQVSAAPTARSSKPPQPSAQSVETTSGAVDDWFESESNISDTRQLSPWAPDDVILPPTGSSTFRRSLFQPINNENNNDTIEHRPPIRPLSQTFNEIKTKRSITPRTSETGISSRSPEVKLRSPPSPVIKKQQTDTVNTTRHQLAKTIAHSLSSKSIPSSTITSNKDRRMSGWSVCERSPNDSDEN